MKKIILSLAIIASSNLHAIGDCIQYPIRDNKIEKYNGTISEVDSETLYGNCPRSVLLNDKFVAQLHMLGDELAEGVCVYRFNTALFACKN